jgi:type III secretory pathway component EscS
MFNQEIQEKTKCYTAKLIAVFGAALLHLVGWYGSTQLFTGHFGESPMRTGADI